MLSKLVSFLNMFSPNYFWSVPFHLDFEMKINTKVLELSRRLENLFLNQLCTQHLQNKREQYRDFIPYLEDKAQLLFHGSEPWRIS